MADGVLSEKVVKHKHAWQCIYILQDSLVYKCTTCGLRHTVTIANAAAYPPPEFGWQAEPESSDNAPTANDHPLAPIFAAAIEQVMNGKGTRHGGDTTPFMEQPWTHYAEMHGRGFLTGQAAKKLEEAASILDGGAFEKEVLGAIVYASMAVLWERVANSG
jgi:hypothetical protein